MEEMIARRTILTYDTSAFLEHLEGKRILTIYQESTLPMVKHFFTKNSIESEFLMIADGELGKTFKTVMEIIDRLLEYSFSRSDAIVAFGGGSVIDTSGFAASIFRRGMGLAVIPTTLLSMVDASLGGKNGINYRGSKNQIGTFYQPDIVYTNLGFINTLPQEEYISGIGEVIKYAFSQDRNLITFLEEHSSEVISRNEDILKILVPWSQRIKLSIVSSDERETLGKREILNVGHTIGHAIESASEFKIKHGIAVMYGMIFECEISIRLGLADDSLCERLRHLINVFEKFPINLPSTESVMGFICNDKKIRGEKINFPSLKREGETEVITISISEFMEVVRNEEIWSDW